MRCNRIQWNDTNVQAPHFYSIYSAKALAISQLLDIIKQDKINNFIIFSDSLNILKSIKNYFQPNSLSKKIQNQISYLQIYAQTITIIWIPSHIGIPGNDLADTYVKQAISSPHSLDLYLQILQDSKRFIIDYILNNWENIWSTLRTKLNKIKPSILQWSSIILSWRQELALNRTRIGLTWLTHKNLISRTNPNHVFHVTKFPRLNISCFCREYNDIRINLKLADNFHEVLSPNPDNIEKISPKLTKL